MKVAVFFMAFFFILPFAAAQIPHLSQTSHVDSLNPAILKLLKVASQTGKRDTSVADSMFRVAIHLAVKDNNHYLAGKAYYAMGEMYFAHENHNKSFGAYFNAREEFEKTNAIVEKAYTLFGMGRQQYFRGNYKAAVDRLDFAMRDAERLHLQSLKSDILEYLGILYHVIPGANARDVASLKKALAIKQQLPDERGSLRIMEKLAEIYQGYDKYDSALWYYDRALRLERRRKLYYDEILTRLDRIGTYVALKRLSQAKQELRKAATFYENKDINISTRYLVQQANYLTATGDVAGGRKVYDTALQVAKRISVPELYGMIYQNMADDYERRYMYQEAFLAMRLYNEQMERYYPQNSRAVAELEYFLNNQYIQDEVQLLSKKNKFRERELVRSTMTCRSKVNLTKRR